MATVGGTVSSLWELKPNKLGQTGEHTDRISNLPDAIVHHILSFISTIDVVRTSVLAKRWKYIWTQVPNLHFDDAQFPISDKEDAFVRFVNGVLSMYTAPIGRYCLSIEQPGNAVFVDDWIRFAVQMNASEIDVELNADMSHCEPFEMPCYESIRDLKLRLGSRRLKLPATGTFSSLEALSLSSVELIDDAIINTVSKQCPCLKKLSFSNCIGLYHLDVSSPLLEDLEIKRCEGLNQLRVSAEKLQFLSVHDSFTYGSSSVKILAPRLQSFNWLDYVVGEFDIGTFTSLKAARVSLVVDHDPRNKGLYLKSAGNFLKSLAGAESLAVEIACFWGLSTHMELLSTPPLNLKHMKLLVGFDDVVFQGISYLFKSCPNLETLEIKTIDEATLEELKNHFGDALYFEDGEYQRYLNQPLDHLQKASLCGFRGEEHEIGFVEFLLKNSVALKGMTIHFSSEVSLNEVGKASVIQRLMEFKRSSTNAIVRVY